MPDDPVLYCVSTAMHHYAKGAAHAALKNVDAAEDERRSFYAAFERIPDDREFFNNSARSNLSVGQMMLNGELEYRKGNYALAFDHLRESVRRDDNLEYTEPWAWMHHPRHTLAALLVQQGHFDEAEDVYRTDPGLNGTLQRCSHHPRSVWALHVLVECLRHRGEADELPTYEKQLRIALAKTDVPVTSSCLCRTDTALPTCSGD